jgi:hypothetical protein
MVRVDTAEHLRDDEAPADHRGPTERESPDRGYW